MIKVGDLVYFNSGIYLVRHIKDSNDPELELQLVKKLNSWLKWVTPQKTTRFLSENLRKVSDDEAEQLKLELL